MPNAVLADDSYAVILAVSPDMDDPKFIEATMPGWRVRVAQTCRDAIAVLQSSRCTVVLCERNLPDGCWGDLLRCTRSLADSPPVIVMSRVADEDMWADVLREGGFDLLAKPLQSSDLLRILPIAQTQHVRATFAIA
jgi:DNA-binding NtrC family response regulator